MAEKKTIAVDLQTLMKGVTCTTKANCTIEVQAKSNLLAELHEELTDVTVPYIAYMAKGPAGVTLEGKTDVDGRITHRDVRTGDYELDFPSIKLRAVVQTTYKGTGYARVVAVSEPEDALE